MTAFSEDLAFLPAHRLAAMAARGEIASAALVSGYLERIGAVDAKLHAFVAVYGDAAMAEAEARDRETRAGQVRGPLHGVPVALKDLCDMEGRVTTCGSLMWKDRISPVTATAVRRLQAAGAVILGKTHMVEFAFGGWGVNTAMGTPWNPWDAALHRVPGGSSSGSGVAVAAGLAPVAIGSDTGGSVRLPASFCGTVGLKPTVGRVSNHGVLPLSERLDTLGPLARSVEDAAILHSVLAGPDPLDPATRGLPQEDVLAGLRAGVAGLRLGVLDPEERADIDDEVLAAYDRACEVLADLGAQLVELRLPERFAHYAAEVGALIGAEAYALHRDWIEDRSLPFDEIVRARMLAAKPTTAADYIRGLARRRDQARLAARILGEVAAFLTPTTKVPAIPVDRVDESAPPPSHFTRAANYLDLCALAVPSGFSRAGLPLSLQVIGAPYAEAAILRIGWAYENAADRAARRPDLAAFAATRGGPAENGT